MPVVSALLCSGREGQFSKSSMELLADGIMPCCCRVLRKSLMRA